jgi:hypothetical protein
MPVDSTDSPAIKRPVPSGFSECLKVSDCVPFFVVTALVTVVKPQLDWARGRGRVAND